MTPTLASYEPIVGRQVIDELRFLSDHLKKFRVRHVNSTATGGGVAEILHRVVPLMVELGIDARWDVVKGGEDFFQVTKKIHNGLHGRPVDFTGSDERTLLETNAENLKTMPMDSDVFFIHDPQPVALVQVKAKQGGLWIWRCHIDLSNPHAGVWKFLQRFVELYDGAVFSAPQFVQKLLIRQFLITPSIDPLSDKNRELPAEEVARILSRLGIPTDKPLVTQVSRFDRLKDPLGVIEAFRLVRRSVNCRLLLVGGSAADDPEGAQVLAEIRERAQGDPDILILDLPPTSHLQINAIQRASAVIVQKSLREGFALTVSEALWKGKPVVASAVGGIPLQIAHKYSGLLCRSIEGAAFAIKQCLNSPAFAKRLGQNGREHVRNNFLVTRQLREYLLLIVALQRKEDVIRL